MTAQAQINLPADQYAHPEANTEWWWHIGTLTAGDRAFGFEIALNGAAKSGFKFTQMMLTDVENQKHYQSTSGLSYTSDWAASQPGQPFYAVVNGPDGAGCMTAFASNPLDMSLQASFTDIDTGTEIVFQLQLNQQGAPLLVWGSGEKDGNYYYSLTNLQTTGRVFLGGEEFPVTGTTWMDHEWGVFPGGTTWALQDMQFDDGMAIMNYCSDTIPALGVPMASTATVLTPDGRSTVYDSVATPLGPTWTDRNGIEYFTRWQVTIDQPLFKGGFEVQSLVPGQAFEQTVKVYEGAASFAGTLGELPVSGTAWNEQKLGGSGARVGPSTA